MGERNFTVEEANRMLPLVRRIVADILEAGARWNAAAKAGKESQQKDLERLKALLAEMEQLGCYYKDWDFKMGLVDFPAVIDGREVFLCWRSDEPDVRHYHPRDAGYAARRTLPQLSGPSPRRG